MCNTSAPKVTESITGIPAETIRTLARTICHASGACPVMYTGLEYSNSGIQAIRAVLSLFALAGHLDVPGGIGLAMPDSHFPINRSCNQENPDLNRAVARDKFPIYSRYRGESHASGLINAVLNNNPYAIRGLIVHGASLLTSWPQTALWREALAKLDFMVCIDRQLTADSAYADIILPASTMFEIDSYMVYGPLFRLREKLIEPVGEARNDYLIMAELAQHLGYGHLYPQDETSLIHFALEGSGHTLEEIKKNGGMLKRPTPMMEYKKWQKGRLRQDGKPGFETPTGKFELWSTQLEEQGYEPLPKYSEPTEGPLAAPALAKQFPLVFNSGARPHSDFRSQHHGIKALAKDNPEPSMEINCEDAMHRGIQEGDLVSVQTPRGSVPFRAHVSNNIVKGAVECNMGGGTPVGSKAWQTWNVNELTDLGNYDEISGFPVYKALLCEVVKLESGQATSPQTERTTHKKPAFSANNVAPLSRPPIPKPQASKPRISKRIYLDNNATTRMAPAVRNAMQPWLDDGLGNPSSIHTKGREAREAVEKARRQLAKLINSKPRRIIFTGSGSESDNLALKGIAYAMRNKGKHIITSSIEHPAVLNSCRFLENNGFNVSYLAVDSNGRVAVDTLATALNKQTILVSLMLANNEVGTIQNIRELCQLTHQHDALFHCDAVQAAGKIPIDVKTLDVDLLSLSGHKFHGPKGIGALYLKKGIKLEPLIHGGKQESGLRAGTENVAAIAGLGKAAELALEALAQSDAMAQKRNRLEQEIYALIPDAQLNGAPDTRLPNTLNMTLPGLRGESLVVALDQHGIALSSGSACKSGSPDPTHVLMAMGRDTEQAHCSVRFSLAHDTTEQEIESTIQALKQILDEMENTVRFLPCK